MMTLLAETALRLIGLFYLFSGIMVVRSLAASSMADATYAAIMGGPPNRAERLREIWLAAGSVLIGAGGLALMLPIDLAAVLFVLGALQQVAYLGFIAPRFLDPEDPPDAAGRARTWNAALVYLVATAVVVAAAWAGLLPSWRDTPAFLLGLAAGAVVAGAVWTVRALTWRRRVGKD